MASIDYDDLLDIVGRIYDCVIDFRQWEPTMALIQRRFRWHNLMLSSLSPTGQGPMVTVMLGFPEKYRKIAIDPAYSAAVLDLWGGMTRISAAPLAEPVLNSQMCDRTDWPSNKYYRDFVEPQGIVDAVAIALARQPDRVATLAGGMHATADPVTDAEMEGLRVIAPHMRRAVAIAHLFDDMRSETAAFAAALETSRAGIVLVDQRLGIVHANSLAHRMLAEGDPIREQQGRLALREELSQDALANAAASQPINLGRSGSGIPTRRLDGSPVLVHVLPLDDGRRRAGMVARASAAIFIAPSPAPIDLPGEALSLLFDLTPAESRVMELISDGLAIADAAQALSVAQSTVKTHLLRVYQKTGTRGQKDLSALARGISIPW